MLAVAEAVAKDPYVESYLKLKSMGKPELIDFDLTGRGELTRLTDTRHSFDAWPALKGDPESVPVKMFGSMPCIKHGDMMLAKSKATAVYVASLGIWKEGRLGETMEESSANKATELVVLSRRIQKLFCRQVGKAGLCDRRDVEGQISISPRCENGELLTTGTASIALDMES